MLFSALYVGITIEMLVMPAPYSAMGARMFWERINADPEHTGLRCQCKSEDVVKVMPLAGGVELVKMVCR